MKVEQPTEYFNIRQLALSFLSSMTSKTARSKNQKMHQRHIWNFTPHIFRA